VPSFSRPQRVAIAARIGMQSSGPPFGKPSRPKSHGLHLLGGLKDGVHSRDPIYYYPDRGKAAAGHVER